MIILQNHTAIRPGLTTSIEGSGGTAPYTYSVLPGGAGGSIDSSGTYTAINNGLDVIRVTDSAGAVADTTVSVLTPMELVCEIIQRELGLPVGSVYIYNQKFNLPKDSTLSISVGVLSSKVFGVSSFKDGSGATLEEIQSVNVRDILDINIFGRSTEALNRKEEVVMALNGVYSQYQQETNSFKIGSIPSNFVNLSSEDGMAIPYRFNISVPIQYSLKKVKGVPYYDTFQVASIVTNE